MEEGTVFISEDVRRKTPKKGRGEGTITLQKLPEIWVLKFHPWEKQGVQAVMNVVNQRVIN